MLAITIINNTNKNFYCKGPRLDGQGSSLLLSWVDPEPVSVPGCCDPEELHGGSFSKELLPRASAS